MALNTIVLLLKKLLAQKTDLVMSIGELLIV